MATLVVDFTPGKDSEEESERKQDQIEEAFEKRGIAEWECSFGLGDDDTSMIFETNDKGFVEARELAKACILELGLSAQAVVREEEPEESDDDDDDDEASDPDESDSDLKPGSIEMSFDGSDAIADDERGLPSVSVLSEERKSTPLIFPFYDEGQMLWGYIDRTGKVRLPARFSSASSFDEGFAFAHVESKLCVIDLDGKASEVPVPRGVVSGLRIESTFSSGLAVIRADQGNQPRMGYVDGKGQWVIEPRYAKAHPFFEGRASVQATWDAQYGLIDAKGREIIAPSWPWIGRFSQGVASAKKKTFMGYIDPEGAFVIKARFHWCWEFHDGLALADGATGQRGAIDGTGRFVVRPQFRQMKDFSEGLAPAMDDKERYGFIDKQGKWVIEPRFAKAEPFSEGLAAVCEDRDQWGFIDRGGNFRIQPRFHHVQSFQAGLALVGERQGPPHPFGDTFQNGYVDSQGRWLVSWKWPPQRPRSTSPIHR
jgi:hypothetical protein